MADIELVIKIPRKVYKAICDKNALGCDIDDIKNIIRNGTPLPKGHGRLIDANNIAFSQFFDAGDYAQAMRGIHDAPTIIEVDKEDEDKCKKCEYYTNPDYSRCIACKGIGGR